MAYDKYIGKTIGKLKILSITCLRIKGKTRCRANCLCVCGNKKDIQIDHILQGNIVSCGCHRNHIRTTHGMFGTVEYATFKSIRARCNYTSNKSYYRYGGVGIKCEWESFEEFYRDMGKRPSDKSSIDRIDNNGNYSKENCSWSDESQQQRNTKKSCYWIIDGVTYNSRTEAAEKLGTTEGKIHTLAQKVLKYQ